MTFTNLGHGPLPKDHPLRRGALVYFVRKLEPEEAEQEPSHEPPAEEEK